MLSEFLHYLVGTLAMVGGILLLERIVAGPHATAGTGYARVDSAFDFDRLLGSSTSPERRACYAAMDAQTFRFCRMLPTITGNFGTRRTFIPVASIVGSVDGASRLFDRNFRPLSDRARARLGSVLVAMREGEPLPPIEVWAWHGEYYVLDGHHRVAAARALGSDYISAHVIEVG